GEPGGAGRRVELAGRRPAARGLPGARDRVLLPAVSAATDPRAIAVEETLAFVRSALPPEPLRVIEIGAGDGALAGALAGDGHLVTALERDPEAAATSRARGGFTVIESDFFDWKAPPSFDALLFTRSLHHLRGPDAAVDRAAALMVPGATLVVEDFAFDRADRATIEWLAGEERRLRADGTLQTDEAPLLSGDAFERWRAHHQQSHTVHRGE